MVSVPGLKSKCKFMFCIALIHLHILLLLGLFTSRADGREHGRGKVSMFSGCPYKATKIFLGRQLSYIGQSLTNHPHTMLFPNSDIYVDQYNNLSPVLSKEFFRGIRLQNLKMAAATAVEVGTVKKEKDKSSASGSNIEVVVLGLSHHHATVDVREKLAIPESQWQEAAARLCDYDSIAEAAVLSTCNRFEVYLGGPNPYKCVHDAMNYLLDRAGGTLSPEVLRRNLFMLSGEDAVWHVLRVSAGLDSLIVGEGQILSQVKQAYEHGIDKNGQAGKVVSRMLNTAVTAGKRVRAETGIARGAVSISSAAAEFSAMKIQEDCNIPSLDQAKISIIGAGKMSRLLLVHLQSIGIKEVTVVNRSPERVEELQREFPDLVIHCKLMPDMWTVIQESDIVYASTAATSTIIDPEPLAEAMKVRNRPGGLQIVDISVPRNVHPDCETVPHVASYNVDNLKAVVERNTAKRRREMVEAESILREELNRYRLWQLSLGAIPTIARLQEKAESLRKEELQKASKKLANLTEKDLEAVDRLSKGIVAKLLHGPMNHLRVQKEADATRAAIQQVQQAFQLD